MKADLHIHTYYSYDSTNSPESIIKAALKKGIDCLAVCDHGKIKGALETIEYAKDKPVLIIPGIEIKSKEGDILGLNVGEIIPNKLSAKETIERIKKSGGLAVIPHPFGWSCSFRGNLEKLVSETKEALIIEVFNASVFGSGNKKAAEMVKKYNLAFTCGSDAHFPNFIGKAYLEIPQENLSGKEAAASSPAESCDSKARSEMRTKLSASTSTKASAVKEVLEAIQNKKCSAHGSEAGFFEKVIDHTKRNFAKFEV